MSPSAPYGPEVRIRIGGPAGFGIKAAGQTLARVFARAGYRTFDLTEYPSLIKGGHNTYHLRVSEEEIFSHVMATDILVALDAATVGLHLAELTHGAAVIFDPLDVAAADLDLGGRQDLCLVPVPLTDIVYEVEGIKIMRNVIALGAVLGHMDFPLDGLLDSLRSQFAHKAPAIAEQNVAAATRGWEVAQEAHCDFPFHLATYEPVVCHGAFAFDRKERTIHRYIADATILATGGLGRIYRNTSNPPGSRGDGLAMAHRAGARIVNAEYVQFHPTTLAVPGAEGFLISEAVRGEGAVLLTPDSPSGARGAGRAFMADYSPQWKDLAPRDVVARAIHHQMETHGYSYVLLDIATHLDAQTIRTRFPNIYAKCLSVGIDITSQPIPVVPAAHYFCGGVLVDEWGRSNIENLYAVGEISCTGLHGANRLASTSLLEGLVWGNRAALHIADRLANHPPQNPPGRDDVPQWDESGLVGDADSALIQGDMQTIQNIMWHYVGLARNAERLSRAIRELRHLWNEIETFYRTTKLSDGLIGLRNAVEVSLIIAQAALHNRQSRGCHYREDSVSQEGDRLI